MQIAMQTTTSSIITTVFPGATWFAGSPSIFPPVVPEQKLLVGADCHE